MLDNCRVICAPMLSDVEVETKGGKNQIIRTGGRSCEMPEVRVLAGFPLLAALMDLVLSVLLFGQALVVFLSRHWWATSSICLFCSCWSRLRCARRCSLLSSCPRIADSRPRAETSSENDIDELVLSWRTFFWRRLCRRRPLWSLYSARLWRWPLCCPSSAPVFSVAVWDQDLIKYLRYFCADSMFNHSVVLAFILWMLAVS